MKKEEFPTFLNEQPTVVFGRTTRELLILAVGLSCGYLLWQGITGPTAIGVVALDILKVICGLVPVVFACIVAFAKVATKPLEEWAVIGLSYLILPKVYLYAPVEEDERLGGDVAEDEFLHAVPLEEDENDRYH